MNKILSLVAVLVLAALPALAQSQDTYGTTTLTILAQPLRLATTYTNSGISISGYIGQPVVVLCSTNIDGTNPSSTVKLQISLDNTNFADLAGGAFTAVTTNSIQSLGIDTTALGGSNYVRIVNTISGTTPTNISSVVLIGRKKYN